MIQAFIKFLLGLFGFGSTIKQEIDHAQVEEEGAIKQANIDQRSEIDADEKEIASMRAENSFADRMRTSPDQLERMRVALNAAAANDIGEKN